MRRDSNPQGCGAEETRSVFQRSTQGAERRSGARPPEGGRGIPPSQPRQLSAPGFHQPGALSCGHAEGFEPARVRSGGNAKRFPAQHARSGATQRGAAAGRRTRNPSVPYQQRALRISTGTWGRSQSAGTKGTSPSAGSSTLKRQTPQARKDQERLTSRKYQPRSEKRAVIYKMARGPGGLVIKFVASSARKEGHLMWPSSRAGL